MWADNETSLDLIGFQVHADLIRSIVVDPRMLPVTIGVFGDWGSGKTSIMQMLRRDLEPDRWPEGSSERKACEKIACLYFNGWLFEGYDDAKSAILTAILLALGEHKRFGPKVRDKVAALLKQVNVMRVVRMGMKNVALPALAAYMTGGASFVPALVGQIQGLVGGGKKEEKQDGQANGAAEAGGIDWESLIRKSPGGEGPLEVRSFREQFGKLLKDSDIDSLVVLVDDMDRCSPERLIDNLEAIKLFLSVERTAFVIGADPRIVRHAVAWRYQQSGVDQAAKSAKERENLVEDYIEKLIQVPYHLPRLSPSETETYMSLLFCAKYAPDHMAKCLEACAEQRARNRYAVFGYGAIEKVVGELDGELAAALALCTQTAPLITDGLKGNPRQVKRFLNALFLRLQLAAVAKLTTIRADVLVKLMILEYAFDERFRELYKWQASQEGHPEQIVSMEKAVGKKDAEKELESDWKGWGDIGVRKWLAMSPVLSDVDLRDYFWIARDRLESTLSGVAMLPPIVRQAAELLLSGNDANRIGALKIVPQLQGNETTTLLGMLTQHVGRHPGNKAGFDALRALMDTNVQGAAAALAGVIEAGPLDPMPPSVGMDVATLLKKKPELGAVFEAAVQKLRQSTGTKIGKAFQAGERPSALR